MTYTPSNRPVGSDAPQDQYFNAGKLDEYVNSKESTMVDRGGIERLTLKGIERKTGEDGQEVIDQFEEDAADALAAQNSTFQGFMNSIGRVDKGTYAAGKILTTRSDVFYRSGFYYRAAPGATLPYTLTGNWAAESANFIVDFGPTNVMPEFYGAQGDGSTTDDSAFTALEAAVKGKMVDLNGRTYVVSAIPRYNAYFNGFFKVGGFTKAAVLSQTFANQPPHFHAFGGQLAKLKSSLSNPLEQFTGLVFIGDSITWGSGNTGEQAPADPRDRTLSDPRDYFGTSSYVNIVKRYIGEKYFFGVDPVLSNWPASPSGQSIATYARQCILYPRYGDFSTSTSGASVTVTEAQAANSITGYQLQMSDGNLAGTSSVSLSFTFTGNEFVLSFGAVTAETALDYELFVDGVSQGVFTTAPGESGVVAGNDNRRTHTFTYVREKVIQLRTKRRAGQTTGSTRTFRPEAIVVNKTLRISNQGINGADTITYKAYNLPPNSQGDGNAVNADDNHVFVQLGTNDRFIAANKPRGLNAFMNTLGLLLDVVTPLASCTVMAANPVSNESTASYSFTMQDVRGVIYRLAKAKSLDMIDNYAATQDVNILALSGDGTHPNALGYAVMARNIINALEQA